MKPRKFLAESNQGNHEGFNRNWTVTEITEDQNPLINIALSVNDNHRWVDDDSDEQKGSWYEGPGVYDEGNNLEVQERNTGYEHDLKYYYIIGEGEIEEYEFASGHYANLYGKLIEAVK